MSVVLQWHIQAGILVYLFHSLFPQKKKKVIAYNKMYGVVENLLTSGF